MPENETIEHAHKDEREGKSPSTQAGEFVHKEMQHIREGKHGARSAEQAIAIGLSKARRAGVKLRAPRRGKASARAHKQARRDYRKGQRRSRRRTSSRRSRATRGALRREGRAAATRRSLSRQGRTAARKRSATELHRTAMKAVRTRGRRRGRRR